MSSNVNHKIKQRKTANDVFITPVELCKKHIDMIDCEINDLWFDPFKNSGNYYNNFPTQNKDYTEILEDKDFFEYKERVDVICSNPPYSMIDRVLEHSVNLNPRVMSYLIGINNLTAKRIEYMNEKGYGLTKLHMCKVFKWFGMSVIVVFEKEKKNLISYDRQVWR
jgi:tRNA1(Val) A37 N6-methylase TrmN6